MPLRGDGMEQRRNGVGERGSKENACEDSVGKLSEAGGGAGGLVDEGLLCRAGCQHRFGRLVAVVAMMASMRWASAAAAGACTAVLAASGLRMAFGVWARGLGWGRSGRIRCRIRRRWGAVAQAAGRAGFAAAPRARGDLRAKLVMRAELAMLARYRLEKGECKNAEGGDRSFWRLNELRVFFLARGDPVEKVPKDPKGSEVRSFQSSVHSGTCGHRAGDRRMEAAAGVGIGEWRDGAVRPAPGCVGDRNHPYGTGVP